MKYIRAAVEIAIVTMISVDRKQARKDVCRGEKREI